MPQYSSSSWVGQESMKQHFPTWTASSTAPLPATPLIGDRPSQSEYVEFILSSNWILRPAGLVEFYRQIRERFEKPEITFEAEMGYFLIRCRRDDQQELVMACNCILDGIVKDMVEQDDDEQLIKLGTTNSDMVRYISEWRTAPPSEMELSQYETFSYPNELAGFDFKATWKVPKDEAREGVTIQTLFLSHDPVQLLTGTIDCAVVIGTDGLTLHFGATSAEDITQVKNKMRNILKYYKMCSTIQVRKMVIYAGNDSTGLVELQYLAQTDRHYLRNVVLDPINFQLEKVYKKLFESGSFVRSIRRENGKLVPAAAKPSPAVPEMQIMKAFSPFMNYLVKGKQPDWNLDTEIPSSMHAVPARDIHSLENVNPLTLPRVLEWAAAVPAFGSMSTTSGKPPSMVSCSSLPLDLRRNGLLPISTDSKVLNKSPVRTLPQVHEKNLQTKDNQEHHGSSAIGAFQPPRSPPASGADLTCLSSLAPGQHVHAPPRHSTSANSSPTRQAKVRIEETACENDTVSTDHTVRDDHLRALREKLNLLKLHNNVNEHSRSNSTASDKELFGEFFATGPVHTDTFHEPHDLLCSSPPKAPADTSVLLPTLPPSLNISERLAPKLFNTMNQKAPRLGRGKDVGSRGVDLNNRQKIEGYMAEMLLPLRFYQGNVTLRAEIGRAWFTKINWQHISIPGMQERSKAKSIGAMEESLIHHCIARDLYFNNVISLFGGDANFISNMPDKVDPSARMWRPRCRHSFYEFWCVTRSELGSNRFFVLDIDAATFSYHIRLAGAKENNVYVHCSMRDFDFRVVVEAAPDIREHYEAFAKEVVSSLRVIPQDGSGPPHLEFVNFRAWGVETKYIRYRQTGIFDSRDKSCKLHVTQVHCMKKKTLKKSSSLWHLSAQPDLGNPQEGYFPMWFEAYVTSNKADEALVENSQLAFAEEASWTFESLKESAAFKDLLEHAANTVRQMDGVGFWVNNQQDNMRYGVPPQTIRDVEDQARVHGPPLQYW